VVEDGLGLDFSDHKRSNCPACWRSCWKNLVTGRRNYSSAVSVNNYLLVN
jgi:hypothetical protein